MLKVDVEIKNFDYLNSLIDTTKKIKQMQGISNEFKNFMKNKVEITLQQVMSERLGMYGSTDNDDSLALYKRSNHFQDTDNGFILINDATIDTDLPNYNGKFSIALAFEYGTGIVGETNPVEGAWNYNVNNHNNYWHYYKDGKLIATMGYRGMEIYRYTKKRVEQNMKQWLKEYMERGVSNE